MNRHRTSILVLVLLVLAGAAHATTFHIPDLYTDLQDALNAAAPGNTTFYGPTDGAGAGLSRRVGGAITVEDCVFTGNLTGWKNAGGGAGAYLEGGTVTVRRCTFTGNHADDGGSGDSGGLKLAGVVGAVIDCEFVGNRAASAGAMAVAFGPGDTPADVTVSGCLFENNSTFGFAGAASVWSTCTARFERCLFKGNTTPGSGGALRLGECDVTVRSCRFEDNSAGTEGGAIYLAYWTRQPAVLAVLDCTFAGNAAGTSGGACHVLANTTLTAFNTDFGGNTAPVGPDGTVVAGGVANLTCCLTDPASWSGAPTLDNTGCAVGIEATTWGGVKASFR